MTSDSQDPMFRVNEVERIETVEDFAAWASDLAERIPVDHGERWGAEAQKLIAGMGFYSEHGIRGFLRNFDLEPMATKGPHWRVFAHLIMGGLVHS